jgi:hypothetical protein
MDVLFVFTSKAHWQEMLERAKVFVFLSYLFSSVSPGIFQKGEVISWTLANIYLAFPLVKYGNASFKSHLDIASTSILGTRTLAFSFGFNYPNCIGTFSLYSVLGVSLVR